MTGLNMVRAESSGGFPNSRATHGPLLTFIERSRLNAGFILADLSLKPIYANGAALYILNFAGEQHVAPESESVQERLRLILQVREYTADAPAVAPFLSGRRRYLCRTFLLDAREGDPQPPLVGLLMERCAEIQDELLKASRRFHLSPRECETVQHLARGLTTKEIAQRMNVSPNTVKQFVRLIMSKMSVTTRSGILGKLLSR